MGERILGRGKPRLGCLDRLSKLQIVDDAT